MNEKGISLIEVLVSLLIGLIVFTSIVATFFYLIRLNESTRIESVVYQDMMAVMERVTNTPISGLNTTFPDSWSLSSGAVANILGNYKVKDESILIFYPNGTTANPREILVRGCWSDRGRLRSMDMRTLKRG